MSYPNNIYPYDPDFPAATNQADFDYNFLQVATSYITALNARANIADGLMDSGNLKMGAGNKIMWATPEFFYDAGTLQLSKLHIPEYSKSAFTVGGDLNYDEISLGIGTDITVNTDLTIYGYLGPINEVISDEINLQQADETSIGMDDMCILWCSTGVGEGDQGDIMIKIRHGSVDKTVTLFDYSAA